LAGGAADVFSFRKAGVAWAISPRGAVAPAISYHEAVPAGFTGEPVVAVCAAPAAPRAVLVHKIEVVAGRAITTRSIGVLNARALAAAIERLHLFIYTLGAVLGRGAFETIWAARHTQLVVEVPEFALRTDLLRELGLVILRDLSENRSLPVLFRLLHVISLFAHLNQLHQLGVVCGWGLEDRSWLLEDVQVAELVHLLDRHRGEKVVLEDSGALVLLVGLVDLVVSLKKHLLGVVERRIRDVVLVEFSNVVEKFLFVFSGGGGALRPIF